MNSKFYLVVAVCVLLMSSVACESQPAEQELAQADDKLTEILNRGTIVVATLTNYPPHASLNVDTPRLEETQCANDQYTANQIVGYDTDTAKEIARRLGVEPCFVAPEWTLITQGNWADRWDINISSMTITEERMENLYFTHPYYNTTSALFVHADNTTYTEPADLSGKRIAAPLRSTHELYLSHKLVIPGVEMNYQIEEPEIIAYSVDRDDVIMADMALGDGVTLDGLVIAESYGLEAIASGIPMKQLGEPLFRQYVGFGIDKYHSKDPIPFVREMSRLVQEMHADGTFSRLSEQHLGYDSTQAAAEFDWTVLNQFPNE